MDSFGARKMPEHSESPWNPCISIYISHLDFQFNSFSFPSSSITKPFSTAFQNGLKYSLSDRPLLFSTILRSYYVIWCNIIDSLTTFAMICSIWNKHRLDKRWYLEIITPNARSISFLKRSWDFEKCLIFFVIACAIVSIKPAVIFLCRS